jgi:hypothetical protein
MAQRFLSYFLPYFFLRIFPLKAVGVNITEGLPCAQLDAHL